MVRRGLVSSRAEAREAIDRGLVIVAGRPASKASTLVAADEPLDVREPGRRFVSRGGEKLDAALQRFGIDVAGRDALDLGASTGGFTDCLLSRGAARVAAVDVGYGQLAWALRADPRVTVLERTNARTLVPEVLPFVPTMVVADLSFISLRLVVGVVARLLSTSGDAVVLVKPQFEAGVEGVGRGGVVREPVVWRRAIEGVVAAARQAGLASHGLMASPLPGPAGNVEFLLWLRRTDGDGPLAQADVRTALLDGERLRSGR